MKTIYKVVLLIVAIIVGFMYYGCESNPCDPVEEDSKNSINISVTIMQDYGYCDSNGCYGESVILYNRTIDELIMVAESFDTESYLRIIGGKKYSCNGFTLVYYTNIECTLEIIGTDIGICFVDEGQLKINLDYNTNYKILWGIQ